MMKVPGWQEALSALMLERMHAPFEWGRQDCCLFAADAVRLQTGEDPAAALRGSYSTERQALRALDGLGGLHQVASAALGEPIPAVLAQVGDVVRVLSGGVGGRDSLAVCVGAFAKAPAEHGLVDVPMERWIEAWRVGWEVLA